MFSFLSLVFFPFFCLFSRERRASGWMGEPESKVPGLPDSFSIDLTQVSFCYRILGTIVTCLQINIASIGNPLGAHNVFVNRQFSIALIVLCT